MMKKLMLSILPILLLASVGFSLTCGSGMTLYTNWPQISNNYVGFDFSNGGCDNWPTCQAVMTITYPKASQDMPQLTQKFNVSLGGQTPACVGDCRGVVANNIYPYWNATRGGGYVVSASMKDSGGIVSCGTQTFSMACRNGEFTCANTTRGLLLLVGVGLGIMFILFAGYAMFQSGDFNAESMFAIFIASLFAMVVMSVLISVLT